MKTTFSTNFLVLPKDCNDMLPLIFGGAFMAEIDKAAASCISEMLQSSDSECDNAVTYKVLDLTFHGPSYMGDIIFLECEVVELRNRAITVQVEAYRKPRRDKNPEIKHVASAKLVFVSRIGDKYANHGLTLTNPLEALA